MAKMVPTKPTQSEAKILHFKKKKIKRTAIRVIIAIWVIQTILTTYYVLNLH